MGFASHIAGTISVSFCLLAAPPAIAQDAIQVPLFDGVLVLRGEVGLQDYVPDPEGTIATFWRPVLFGTSERPIGGRMDCRLGGVRQEDSDELFDVRARYEENRSRRLNAGLLDEDDPLYEGNDEIARLEVTGRANDPHRHYVLTYLAMRAPPYLYDIRLNCEFKHLNDPGDVDYAAIMHQFVDIAVPLAAPPSTNFQPNG